MSECIKISCGTGRHCPQCKYIEAFMNMSVRPSFTKNALGRCDFYTDKKHKAEK